ncbi:SEC-C metal-binding domain-containing protein [Paenibacillus sp. M1]|uniref:SEC-C metal-binding domain-containing protein n=1 Tax=Paenibacillus haidiansis TaxID=1574488 RepID=A0ABU7VWE7_9BACL
MITEFEQMLEQTNIQHAIVGEGSHGLREILAGLTKTRLSSLAKIYTIPGRSKMSQDELAKAAFERITDPGLLESLLPILDPEEWAVFKAAYAEPFIQDNHMPFGYYHSLLERGLIFTYFHQGKLYLIMPDEVKAAFAAMNTEAFREARRKHALVLKYLLALTNLYGVYTPDKLLDIFNGQNAAEPLSKTELEAYIGQFLQREQKFVLEEESGYLVDSGLAHYGKEGELEALLQQIQGKPHYVPDKDELLKYADDGYFEFTPQLAALKNYVLEHLCDDVNLVDGLVDDIQLGCSMGAPLEELLDEFEKREILIEAAQAKQVIGLLFDVSNHTRIWANCGHTPAELGSEKTMDPQTGGNNPVRVKKVGRNEPCPCGSGLKYKKCCGK